MTDSPKPITASDVRFRGDIPEVYDRYLGPLLFEPYAADLATRVAKLKPPTVLEIATGTGILTRQLLRALPGSTRLTATDLNEPMLEVARRKIGDDSRVTWRQADALDLPFESGSFDAIVCQFGVMFFPDKTRGLREFRRVLRPGGHLSINLWGSLDENPHGRIAHTVIRDTFKIDPPAFYEVPFGLHDVAEIRALVSAADFDDIRIETVDLTGESPSAADAAIGLVRGNPCINLIMERGPDRVESIEADVSRILAERYGDHPLRIPMRAHVVSAVKGV
jgi:ubiquinone/menaquinone biosynthesis C-methylase UbiE